MRQAHQPKEHVNIDNMLDCVEGYTAMLCDIYGIDFTQCTK
jgi:acetylornithine deacetylase/succinyl-diaminopimelate desuccinylase-like protein